MGPVAEAPQPSRFVIVVGVDFANASRKGLMVASELAQRLGSSTLLHAVHVMAPLRVNTDELTRVSRERLVEWIEECAEASAPGAFARVEPHLLLGDAAVELEVFARVARADLIVLGAHRRGRLWAALHPSVSARLARRAPCSVLITVPTQPLEQETVRTS